MNTNLYDEMAKYNSIKARIEFELVSMIGRMLFRHRSKIVKKMDPLLLDIGVGSNYTSGWQHVDFFQIPLNPIHWLTNILSGHRRRPEFEVDLRYPLICKDNVCDGIYCSHTLEHLLPGHAIQLMREIFRILKPNSYVRMIVPDLGKVVANYISRQYPPGFSSGCELIMNCTQTWGHLSAWDKEYLTEVLSTIGFVNIGEVEFGEEGKDKRLIKEELCRKKESIVIEAQKPNIIQEAIKVSRHENSLAQQ